MKCFKQNALPNSIINYLPLIDRYHLTVVGATSGDVSISTIICSITKIFTHKDRLCSNTWSPWQIGYIGFHFTSERSY